MKTVFRTTWKYWLREEGFALLFAFLLVLGAYWFGQVLLVFCALVIGLLYGPAAYKLWKTYFEIDEQGFFLHEKNNDLQIRWGEIVRIELVESSFKPKKQLVFSIKDIDVEYDFQLTLDHFEYRQIWKLIQQLAPVEALEEDAYRGTASYQEWLAEETTAMAQTKTPIQVADSWWEKIAVWILLIAGIVLFVLTLIDVKRQQAMEDWEIILIPTVISLFLVSLGVYGVCSLGKLELDNERIAYLKFRRRTQIRWDEIFYIEEMTISKWRLFGGKKSLVISTPTSWSGHRKEEAVQFFNWKIELYNIKVRSSESLFRRMGKKIGSLFGKST